MIQRILKVTVLAVTFSIGLLLQATINSYNYVPPEILRAQEIIRNGRSKMKYFDSVKQGDEITLTEGKIRLRIASSAYYDFYIAQILGVDPGTDILDAADKRNMYLQIVDQLQNNTVRKMENKISNGANDVSKIMRNRFYFRLDPAFDHFLNSHNQEIRKAYSKRLIYRSY